MNSSPDLLILLSNVNSNYLVKINQVCNSQIVKSENDHMAKLYLTQPGSMKKPLPHNVNYRGSRCRDKTIHHKNSQATAGLPCCLVKLGGCLLSLNLKPMLQKRAHELLQHPTNLLTQNIILTYSICCTLEQWALSHTLTNSITVNK